MDTLFPIELPFIDTNEALPKLMACYPNYDPDYIAIACIRTRRHKIDALWPNFRPYADPHFLKEITTHFHQRSWEMYIGNVLLQTGFKVNTINGGPDFIVNDNMYIECVAPTKGEPNQKDSVPELFIATYPEKVIAQEIPVDKIILRITNSLTYKAQRQYKNWENKNWFNARAPFIIAINTADLMHGDTSNLPLVLKALFGFNELHCNMITNASHYTCRDDLKKENNTSSGRVPVNSFTNQELNFVSGILFSGKHVINHPEIVGDDCVFVNNPFSINPVDKSFIEYFKNWVATKSSDGISLQSPNDIFLNTI